MDSKKATRMIALPQTSFYREVEPGNIPYILEKGKKRGMLFPKEAIELHAQRRKKSKKKPVRHCCTRENKRYIRLSMENGREIYGEEDIVPYKKVLEWRDINDEMTMCIQENSQFVGSTTIMPLEEQTIQNLIYDRLRERDIPNEAIKKWIDPKLSVYIASITVQPSEDEDLELDRERGSLLLRHTIKWGIMLSHQYDIKNWYAIGTTPTGQKILEHLGFQEVVSLDNGERKGYTLRNLLKARIVQQFMDEMEQKDLLLSDQRTKFMMATPDDILDEYNLATSIFGDAVHDVPIRRAWLARNPGTDFIVRDREQLMGFLNLLPVKHNTIMKFMRGEIRGWDIPAEDILPYTPNSEVECIVMGMATTPEALPNKRTQYGRRLISGVAQFLREL